MFPQLLSLGALLVSSSLATTSPAHLGASGVFSDSFCTWCGSIGAFETGEGTNVAILTNDTNQALYGQFDNTYWTFNGLSGTYSLYMSPTADSTFANYGTVGINAGYTTPGFGEGDEDGLLVWNNSDMANAGSFFALCPRVIPGYESEGVQAQVFWQSNEAPFEGTADCKPIVIHGAYE